MNALLSVRPALADDLAFLAGLDAEAFGAQAWGEPPLREIVEGKWPTGYVLVAELDSVPVGYALLSVVLDDAELQQIAIVAEQRGRGLGRTLLDSVHTWLGEHGTARVVLEVRGDNVPAIALYEGSGYRQVSRRTGYYSDGTDALIYDRPLP